MTTDIHDPAPFRAMDDATLLAAYLSYRATARTSRGSDWLFDQNRTLVTFGVCRERGLTEQAERAVAVMKASRWLAVPADVAREVLEPKAVAP